MLCINAVAALAFHAELVIKRYNKGRTTDIPPCQGCFCVLDPSDRPYGALCTLFSWGKPWLSVVQFCRIASSLNKSHSSPFFSIWISALYKNFTDSDHRVNFIITYILNLPAYWPFKIQAFTIQPNRSTWDLTHYQFYLCWMAPSGAETSTTIIITWYILRPSDRVDSHCP